MKRTRRARSLGVGALAGLALAAAGVSPALGQDAAPSPRPAWLRGSPPAGWVEMPSLSRSVGVSLRQSAPLGDLATRSGALAHAERGVGAFYLSWIEADAPAPDGPAAIRVALDRVRHARLASSPDAQSTEELAHAEVVEGGVARADLTWRHVSNETLSRVRARAWLSPDGKPRLAVAECVVGTSGGAAPLAVEKTCDAALASMEVAVPDGQRGALSAVPPAVAEPGGERGVVSEALALPGALTSGPPPATVGPAGPAADGPVLYSGPAREEERSSSRWMVILGALLVLASLTAFMRARRARGEPAAEDGEGGPVTRDGDDHER